MASIFKRSELAPGNIELGIHACPRGGRTLAFRLDSIVAHAVAVIGITAPTPYQEGVLISTQESEAPCSFSCFVGS